MIGKLKLWLTSKYRKDNV